MNLHLKKTAESSKIRAKTSGCRGETLVETLCAVLLCELAVLILAGALTAAARINNANEAADERFRADLSAAESYEAAADVNAQVRIVVDSGGIPTQVVTVESYGDADGDFVSYRKKVTEP